MTSVDIPRLTGAFHIGSRGNILYNSVCHRKKRRSERKRTGDTRPPV
jgi:hypothetical protein